MSSSEKEIALQRRIRKTIVFVLSEIEKLLEVI